MDWLTGKQVAFTGKLASMTRKEAGALVRAHGGQVVTTVNRQTSCLVVGQDGWPLQANGKLTGNLQKARRLQIDVLTEEELLTRLGSHAGVHRHYTLAQLAGILQVPGNLVRSWLQHGLIEPVENCNGVNYFDYGQVVGAKTLCDLTEAGVTTQRIRRSLRRLQTWLGDQPLAQLALLERNGQLLVRLEDGLVEPTGQMQLDFADDARVIAPSPADWFALGCQHEQDGCLTEAAEAYRQALLQDGPDADVCFNLANTFVALGQLENARERYYQVLELDGAYFEAWNNLGILLRDAREYDEAIAAFRRAIHLGFQDAHFNLADLLDDLGRRAEAHKHWQAYVQHDPHGQWGQYAKNKLG